MSKPESPQSGGAFLRLSIPFLILLYGCIPRVQLCYIKIMKMFRRRRQRGFIPHRHTYLRAISMTMCRRRARSAVSRPFERAHERASVYAPSYSLCGCPARGAAQGQRHNPHSFPGARGVTAPDISLSVQHSARATHRPTPPPRDCMLRLRKTQPAIPMGASRRPVADHHAN